MNQTPNNTTFKDGTFTGCNGFANNTTFKDGTFTGCDGFGFGSGSQLHVGNPPINAPARQSGIAKIDTLRLSKECCLFTFQTRKRIENIQEMRFKHRNGKICFRVETMDTTTQAVVTTASVKQTCEGSFSVTLSTANGKFSLLIPNWKELNSVLEYLPSSVTIEPLGGNRNHGRNVNARPHSFRHNGIESSSGFDAPLSSIVQSKNSNNNNNNRNSLDPSFWKMYSTNASDNNSNNNNSNNNSNSSFGHNTNQVGGQGQALAFNTNSFGGASMNGNVLHLHPKLKSYHNRSGDKLGMNMNENESQSQLQNLFDRNCNDDQKQQQPQQVDTSKQVQLNHCLCATVAGRNMHKVSNILMCYYNGARELYCRVTPKIDSDVSAMQFAFPIMNDYIHFHSSNIGIVSFFENKNDYLHNSNCKASLAFGGLQLASYDALPIFGSFIFELWCDRHVLFDRRYYWKNKMYVKLEENKKEANNDNNNNNGNVGQHKTPFLSLFATKLEELSQDFESQLKIVLLGINGDLKDCSFEQTRRDLSRNHNNLDTKACELLIGFYKNNRDIGDDYHLSILETLFGSDYAFGAMVVASFDVLMFLDVKEKENEVDIEIDGNNSDVFEQNLRKYFGKDEKKITIAQNYSLLWNNSNKIDGKKERDINEFFENEIIGGGDGGISK